MGFAHPCVIVTPALLDKPFFHKLQCGGLWMSKLGCKCGHVIHDQTDHLSYKGYLLPDIYYAAFFDWLVQELQGYVAAAEAGATEQWLRDKGYTPDYVALKLNHGHALQDHIHAQFCTLKRDVYECEA